MIQTRRQFLVAGAPVAAAVLTPQAFAAGLTSARKSPAFRGGRFSSGVLSGDPGVHSMTLLTHLDGVQGAGSVGLEVATDATFRKVVATKQVRTSDAIGHSVKATVQGLKPHTEYFYRFATRTTDSPVGRFRTALPADSNQPVSFAFFSCQDYTHGYYNAHEILAKGDYDFVICLGDYIYDESYHSRQDGTGVRNDPIGRAEPGYTNAIRAAQTLDDYRAKYRLYRSDASLRKVHQNFPMVILWDDHEVQDNYAGKEPDGGLPAVQRYSRKRRAVAYKAFFESMPLGTPGSSKIYRRLQFGKTVDLFIMDQRQYRANQPCDDGVSVPCADYDQPRDFLGRPQMNWLKAGLSSSKASWKVLANEVTMMPTKVLGGAYFGFDSWQGYARERQELLTHIKDRAIKDVVFVTGDIHTFIAGDVQPDRPGVTTADTVATEFVGGSISSSGLGETDLPAGDGIVIKGNDQNPATPPSIIDTLRGINPWVDQADFDHHGFGEVKATKDGLSCSLVRLETIKRRSTKTLDKAAWTYTVKRGSPSIKGQHGPAA